MPTTTPPSTRASAVVGFLVCMELASGLLQGWFPPLLSSLGESYGVSAASLNWVNASYMLATIMVVPLLSKLGDVYGHKRLLLISSIIVALASVLVALAPTYWLFLLGRAIQAPLATFLPLEFAIVHQRDPEHAGRSIGKLVGALTLGAALGGLVAGALLDAIGSLTLTMLVPAAFMALCAVGVAFLVKETPLRKEGRADLAGALLLGAGLVLVLGAVSNLTSWSAALTVPAVAAGLVLLLVWVRHTRRSADPLIDLQVLLHGGIGLPIVVAFLYGAQMFGSQAPISLYLRSDPGLLGYGFGVSATVAGLTIAINAGAAFLGATLSDRVARLLSGPRAVAAGGLMSAVAFALMILVPGTLVLFTVWLVLAGLGAGIVIGALPTIVVDRAEADSVGIASGLYNTARTAAGAVSGAVFALVMASLSTTGADGAAIATHASFHTVWWICAGLCALFAVLALFIRPRGVGAGPSGAGVSGSDSSGAGVSGAGSPGTGAGTAGEAGQPAHTPSVQHADRDAPAAARAADSAAGTSSPHR